jgi:hypothetical protein
MVIVGVAPPVPVPVAVVGAALPPLPALGITGGLTVPVRGPPVPLLSLAPHANSESAQSAPAPAPSRRPIILTSALSRIRDHPSPEPTRLRHTYSSRNP